MAHANLLALVISTVAIGVLGGAARYFSPANRLKRQLRSLPRRTLAGLSEGTTAHVAGKAEALNDTLEAPLSGRLCLYYATSVTVHEGSSWWQLAREERWVSFILDDGTARAIVDPNSPKAVLDVNRHDISGSFRSATPRELAFHQKHGASTSEDFFEPYNRRLTYEEAIIEVGDRIVIVGEAVREPDPDGTPEDAYRGDAPMRLRMTGSPKQPMIISNVPSVTREA